MARLQYAVQDGIFDSATLKLLTTAYNEAIQRAVRGEGGIDGRKLARQIFEHARTGETDIDLLWRAALARTLVLERREEIAR